MRESLIIFCLILLGIVIWFFKFKFHYTNIDYTTIEYVEIIRNNNDRKPDSVKITDIKQIKSSLENLKFSSRIDFLKFYPKYRIILHYPNNKREQYSISEDGIYISGNGKYELWFCIKEQIETLFDLK